LTYTRGKLVRRDFQVDVPSFVVISIAETPDGIVWVGTRGRGLFSLAKDGESVIARGPGTGSITCLLPAGGRELWVGADTGVMRWNGAALTTAGVAAQLTSSPVLT